MLYLQKYYPNTISFINIQEIIRSYKRNYLIDNKNKNLTDKFIPFNVIRQFDENISSIDNKVDFVLASIMRNTGLRCNEIFNIKYDKCIVMKNGIYYIIIENIAKTRITNKLLPIKADLALEVLELSEKVKKISIDNINKEKYLFINLSGANVGKRISDRSFINRLNKWAVNNKITDDNGDIFVFKTHSFRHTVATELLNSGMSIENVQKWMSHLNKDMTLNYARPLSDMISREYKKIQNHSLDIDFKCIIADYRDIEKLDLNNRLNKVIKKLGYCIKPKQINCKYSNDICSGCKFLRDTGI